MKEITIRVIGEDGQGYIIYSASDSEKIISGIGCQHTNNDLLDPDKNKTLQISLDESYTGISLYKDVCTAIGIEPKFSVDSDLPAYFDMLLELEGNILISVEDHHVPLYAILKTFSSDFITVYIKFIFGRGEVYRGDGIKMIMRAEPGIRHHGAHVHVEGKDGRSATFPVGENGKYEGNLNKRECRTAKRIIQNNQKVLMGMWNALNVEGFSIDIDYKLGRISFRRNSGMKVCIKATQELGLNASEESIAALDAVKYGPVHEVEEVTNDLFNQMIDEFEEINPDYKYVKAELHYKEEN